MKTIQEFIASLEADLPANGLSPQLTALWYDGKSNWHQAHRQVDHLDDKDSAWVHAYLHRKEGDLANAGYWYRRAGKISPSVSLNEEWAALVSNFLG